MTKNKRLEWLLAQPPAARRAALAALSEEERKELAWHWRLTGIGRVWADGKLLRGEAGDLKVAGSLRIYGGRSDQPADPLIAAIEGADRCPAHRGLAYVVFEDLDLSEFYNRLPALTFEVIADDGFGLDDIVGEVVDDVDGVLRLDALSGFTCEGSLVGALRQLETVFPIDADANGPRMTLARDAIGTPIVLSEAATAVDDGDFGGAAGFARQRSPLRESPPEVLRYYDVDRDYQPGLQRSPGRPGPGQPVTIEIPASMTATNARILVEGAKQKAAWSRDRLSWRTSELHPAIAPGSTVAVPGQSGLWRVVSWEWRASGVELALERAVPNGASQPPALPVDSGRINPVLDLPAPATDLLAFELPWDGSGSADTPRIHVAVSSSGTNWSGAALFVDHGAGDLQSLGPSGRGRSIAGTVQVPPAAINPLLADRRSAVTIELLAQDMVLANATPAQLASGANRALLGEEIVQFTRAEFLGDRIWRISGLLRGRGGTEHAVGAHLPGERFVLLDTRVRLLDATLVGTVPGTEIVAAGRGDDDPVRSAIGLRGMTLRPLSPVHPRSNEQPGGSLHLTWTRRSRGGWQWLDGVDAPLREEFERYLVTYGPLDAPVSAWTVTTPEIDLDAAAVAQLRTALPGGAFHVRQQGSFALSTTLLIATLS